MLKTLKCILIRCVLYLEYHMQTSMLLSGMQYGGISVNTIKNICGYIVNSILKNSQGHNVSVLSVKCNCKSILGEEKQIIGTPLVRGKISGRRGLD